MPPLNNAPLWRAFARRQINQAYADAGYRPDNGNATRLHGDPTIQARLAELQAEVTKETKLTVESLVNELEAARQKATDLKRLSAAVRAIEAKAKVSGLLVQKMEVGGPW